MTGMKVSIAVPSFNHRLYIEDCLSSILMQDYKNYEVLIADGGSSDGSIEIIMEYCNRDNRFKLVSTSDRGQSDGLNKAFLCADGKIYCFLNSDDCYITKDAITKAVESFQNYPSVDIISFGGYYLDEMGRIIKPVRMRYHPLDSIALMRYRTAVLQPATFWLNKVSKSIPLDTESHYAFDSIFFYQAYLKYSWLELSEPVAGHRLHGGNKSLQISADRINDLVRFEVIKSGPFSYRVAYLKIISNTVWVLSKVPLLGNSLCKGIYLLVNSISFISVYRIPGI
ncbi:glycosyltransferase [Polynucleobacter sp. AP-Sanab-80-C2]|uniref:glycosyltransferase n=1 Tax=Polynucleobacter sp. AP-Sanab-80-C2 TaxID=3108274 RepID=UPI002B2219A9|nr:glycosyltransferase [Polynucleobacter sp. AP-Sanab-80-C2]MEA9598546.1 glycosyltransferase [Polynucleobacter sp. AP-Sanab-80-C2]